MPSVADIFTADGAACDAFTRGDAATLLPAAGGDPVALPSVIILNDPLAPRSTDGGKRLEYPVRVQIPIADYPAPIVKGDRIQFQLWRDDLGNSTRRIGARISQVNGMWDLGLD